MTDKTFDGAQVPERTQIILFTVRTQVTVQQVKRYVISVYPVYAIHYTP